MGIHFSEILIKINTFSFKKMHLEPLCGKSRPICLDLNVWNTDNRLPRLTLRKNYSGILWVRNLMCVLSLLLFLYRSMWYQDFTVVVPRFHRFLRIRAISDKIAFAISVSNDCARAWFLFRYGFLYCPDPDFWVIKPRGLIGGIPVLGSNKLIHKSSRPQGDATTF